MKTEMNDTQYPNDLITPISLVDLWNTIYRRKILVAATVLAFLVLGFLFYLLSPNIYTARAVVLLENQQRDVQIKAVLTAEVDEMLIPSEIQVLNSIDLMGKVVDNLGLLENPTLLTDEPDPAYKDASVAQLSERELDQRRSTLISSMLGNIQVRQIEKSRAIEILFSARNPVISADVVNTLTKLYIEQQLSSNFDVIRVTNEWLAARVRETQEKVLEADRKVAEYRAAAGIVDSRGIDLIEQNIGELSNQLTSAKARAAEAEARLSAISEKGKLEAAPEILASPLIQALRQREAENRDELAALQNQLGSSHPKVQTARAQVSEINAKIKQEITKLAEGLRREHQSALDAVANLEDQIAELKVTYNQYRSDNVDLAALESEAAINREFLETLNLRYQETQSQEDNAFQMPYARIISPAPIPQNPSSPKGKLIMAASLLIGLALGCGLALGLDHIQAGVYNGNQLQRITGKTNIAVIPKAPLKPSAGLNTHADYVTESPASSYMQEVRALSTFLRLEKNQNPDSKIFNFTSATDGEGKSAVVATLARQLSLEGVRVLAIDFNGGQPTLTNTFGLMNRPGLGEILSGEAKINDVVNPDAVSGAAIMGIGRGNGANSMSRDLDEWKGILNGLAAQFDIVLLDSPPILSAPETKLIAKLSKNIFCVRWRKTPVKLLNFTLDTLARIQAPIAGTVIIMSENPPEVFKANSRL